jgi:hypothetical protein
LSTHWEFALAATLLLAAVTALAQTPGILSRQAKLTVNGTNFTGTAHFKFALVNEAGNATPNDSPISLAVAFGGQAGNQRVAALQTLVPQPAWYFYSKL